MRFLHITLSALFLFLTIRLFGGAVEWVGVKTNVGVFLALHLLPWLLVGLGIFWVQRRLPPKPRFQTRLWVLLTFFLLILLSYLAVPAMIGLFHTPHRPFGVWAWPTTCTCNFWPVGDWTAHTDELGLRNPPTPQRDPDETQRVALLGDSFFFGLHLNDADTLAVKLQSRLESQYRNLRVINAAMPGHSLVSQPGWIGLLKKHRHPDLFVLHISEDDIDATDLSTRLTRSVDQPSYRLAQALNLETLVEIARVWTGNIETKHAKEDIIFAMLEPVVAAAGSTPLLIVSDLNIPAGLNGWLSSHPQVGFFDAYDNADWQAAERLDWDHHWSAKGHTQIAELLASPVAAMLAHPEQPYRDSVANDTHRSKTPQDGQDGPSPLELRLAAWPLNQVPGFRVEMRTLDTQSVHLTIRSDSGLDVQLQAYFCRDSSKHYRKLDDLCFSVTGTAPFGPADEAALRTFFVALEKQQEP